MFRSPSIFLSCFYADAAINIKLMACNLIMQNEILRSRLKCCLQTIIDLESCMAEMSVGKEMLNELETLKSFMSELDRLSLTEEEVARVEHSTNIFLSELSLPAARRGQKPVLSKKLQ